MADYSSPLHTVYLLGGSNLGDRMTYLQQAEKLIEKHIGKIIKQSPIYQTASWADNTEPLYLNIVWAISTTFAPNEVLQKIMDIETSLGRIRTQKWAPRTIDIDILFYDNDIIQEIPTLIIPHPHLQSRKFCLLPLHFLSPKKIHPVLGKTITQLLSECTDTGSVKIFDKE